ncbi:MAG: hypothetical protein WD810_03425 [Solirubrobacterales bacterium]
MSVEAGIDTWSVCWYLRDESTAVKAMESLATVPAPRSKLIEESVLGHRVGWFPGSRLLFAEGHPSSQGLCKADALPGVLEALSESLADLGVLPPAYKLIPHAGPQGFNRALGGSGFGGIRRMDATVDLKFDQPADGLAALAGVAALPLPRIKTEVEREVGGSRIETVTLHGSGGRSILGRWYDKGIESGSAGRGLHIRPEDQRRFAKDARPPVDVVAQGSFVRDAFVRRFEPLWRAAKGVKVAGPIELAQRLGELQDEGRITAAEAKAIAGHLLLQTAGAQRQSRAQCYKDRAAARRHGLVLADGVLDHVEVDLGEILEQVMDAEAWGAQG